MILLPFISDGKVSKYYLTFKIVTSTYLAIAYAITHYSFNRFKSECKESNSDKDPDDGTASWAHYWIYLTFWCFTILVAGFIFETILVSLRYIDEWKFRRQSGNENIGFIKPNYRSKY